MSDETENKRRDKGYSKVVTMDGSALLRPQHITPPMLVPLAIFLVIAAIIGFNAFSWVSDNIIYAGEREAAAVTAQLNRNVSLNLPDPSLFIGMDDDEITENMLDAGLTVFANDVSDGTSLELVKLPSDITVDQGKEMLGKGISKLSAEDAAKLLNGMWRLDVSRGDSTTMTLRYSDFSSGSADAAISNAMTLEGLPVDGASDSNIDDSGNTYREGTIEVNGITTTWRVSSIALSEVYSINAVPETAMYVGIRYTY